MPTSNRTCPRCGRPMAAGLTRDGKIIYWCNFCDPIQEVGEQGLPMRASRNLLLAALESNPALALALFAAILLGGLWVLPFGDLIVEGLWPYKEVVAGIVLALGVLVVLGREFRRNIEALVAVGVVVHKRLLKHRENAVACRAIPCEGWGAPQATDMAEDSPFCYEQQLPYQR